MEEDDQQKNQITTTFFLLINTKSGNQEGLKIIDIASNPQSIISKINQPVHVNFFDLFQPQILEKASKEIKTIFQQEHNSKVYVIVCGGDGTISWVVNGLDLSSQIMTQLIFGILPIGTGNDMCRSLGWDGISFEVTELKLAQKINEWLTATVQNYDLWQVTLKTFDNGKIYDIHNCIERETPEKTFTKMFTNYLGMGLDARIVYTMERHRTSYAMINRILYTLVGSFNFFRPLKQLSTSIASFAQKKPGKQVSQDQSRSESSASSRGNLQGVMSNGPQRVRFKNGYRGLVCLNCTSYMSGVRNIWETDIAAHKNRSKQWQPQSSSDGLIQFVAFKNELKMALERIISSGGKVAQGSGPFQIVMNRPEGPQTTYFEIDGQSVKVLNLKSIEIERAKCSRIRVLARR